MIKPVMLTGDRPTGPLHLGHYQGSLKSRLAMQDSHECWIMVADGQALTDHFSRPEQVGEHIFDVVQDYLAVGIDPKRCTIFVQSAIPELFELMFYYLNLVTTGRLSRNPTVKAEIQQKKNQGSFNEGLPVGFFCYPVSQAADITAFGRLEAGDVIVPVGDDQLPMIEQTNEIVDRFHHLYLKGKGEGGTLDGGKILCQAKAKVGKVSRLVGIDGQAKASKSLHNAIFLRDSADQVREKVFAMYTDPMHIHVNDPGVVEGHVVFAYLDAFAPDLEEINSLKAQYRRGGLGDVTLKKLLNQYLHEFLEPIRQRYADVSRQSVTELLVQGTEKARKRAGETLQRVRSALGISRF